VTGGFKGKKRDMTRIDETKKSAQSSPLLAGRREGWGGGAHHGGQKFAILLQMERDIRSQVRGGGTNGRWRTLLVLGSGGGFRGGRSLSPGKGLKNPNKGKRKDSGNTSKDDVFPLGGGVKEKSPLQGLAARNWFVRSNN